ncbi:MAG TPA: hypothetical protein VFD28_00665 [Candidatus Eisenbacteria bacterium]|nr:hypothetical protein [Candidatus Eisenbacteria bacterium]
MTFFTRSREECQRMTFEEFINKVKDIVREKNYMNLIGDWEKHIIHSDFSDKSSSIYGSMYYGTIYFANTEFTKTLENPLKITLYTFSYCGTEYSANLKCTECSLYKKEIEAISKLSQCFNAEENRFFNCHRSEGGCPEQPKK